MLMHTEWLSCTDMCKLTTCDNQVAGDTNDSDHTSKNSFDED